jgi:hypothetical protein
MAHRLAFFFHARSIAGEFDHAPATPTQALGRIDCQTFVWRESSICPAIQLKPKSTGYGFVARCAMWR